MTISQEVLNALAETAAPNIIFQGIRYFLGQTIRSM